MAFTQQGITALLRRREMQVGDRRNPFPISFLRKRLRQIKTPETRLVVRDFYLLVKTRDGRHRRARGVALNDNPTRFPATEDIMQSTQDLRGGQRKRLIGPHDIQIRV